MNWTDLLHNPEGIAAIFSDAPSLDKVQIREIIYNQDGPCVVLRFDLQEFPRNPPEKWKRQKFNVVQVSLMCLGVHAVVQEGWGTQNITDIHLERNSSTDLRLRTSEGPPKFNISFDILRVHAISAYQKDSTGIQ